MHKTDARGVEVPVKRGIAVWILGFLTFLAALNSFGAVTYWISRGRDSVVTPYLIGAYTGELRTETYFWISITITFVFLGLTCIIAYRKLPPDPEIIKMFVKVGGNLAALRKTQEAAVTELSEKLEANRTTSEQLFRKANANLENARKETLDMLKKHEAAMREVGRLSKRGAAAIKKQRKELEDIRTRLEKIESELTPPQPRLKSQSSPEEIRGIGPRLREELKSIGITSVGELITADPAIIDEKTRVSREMAERLQATAQLLMVPGVSENDAELLIEAGVTSRRELASQDLVSLGRKIGEITKTYIEEGKMSEDERPTIEEISSWIRMAKY
jgi:hypothetical protein